MKKSPVLSAVALLAATGLALTGCASGAAAPAETAEAEAAPTTVTITDNRGEIEVPVDPERVVALDNTSFQTLSDWGIELVAAPKPLMYDLWPNLSGGEEVLDVGLHREPNIEAVIEADPDLIVGGYRFQELYDQLVEIQPATIEVNARDGEEHVSELKRQVELLGQVFGREDEAKPLPHRAWTRRPRVPTRSRTPSPHPFRREAPPTTGRPSSERSPRRNRPRRASSRRRRR